MDKQRVSDYTHASTAYLQKRATSNAFWTRQALRYGTDIAATASTAFICRATLKRLKSLVKSNSHVLEVGCGNATSLLAPLSRLCYAYGVDLTLEMLLAAKNHHKQIKGLVRGDACCLPFPDKHFDVVYTSRCLINILDPEMQRLGIRELFRVAKSDAVVALVENFQEPVMRMNVAIDRYRAGSPVMDDHNLWLNLQDTVDYCRELGWRPIRIRGNTMASFLSQILLRNALPEQLLYPVCAILTDLEDRFGEKLPLYGKDTFVVFQNR